MPVKSDLTGISAYSSGHGDLGLCFWVWPVAKHDGSGKERLTDRKQKEPEAARDNITPKNLPKYPASSPLGLHKITQQLGTKCLNTDRPWGGGHLRFKHGPNLKGFCPSSNPMKALEGVPNLQEAIEEVFHPHGTWHPSF